MGRTLFHSTLREKNDLYERLARALPNGDIETALRVVEDAKMLHEFHRTLQAVEVMLECHRNGSGAWAIQRAEENITALHKKIEKMKKKSRRSVS